MTVHHSLLCLALRNHEAPKTERSVAARLEGVPTANRGQSAALKAPGIPEATFSMPRTLPPDQATLPEANPQEPFSLVWPQVPRAPKSSPGPQAEASTHTIL